MRCRSIYFILLSLAIVGFYVADVAIGSVDISLREIWESLCGRGDDTVRYIILHFRLPKATVALLAGAALSASGLQMQTLFRNPLAGPYVLGVSSGASLGVALFLLGLPLFGASAGGALLRNVGIVGAAWLGSALILAAVMSVSSRIKDIMVILILGMMFGSVAGAFVEMLQYFSSESALKSFVVWTMGSLGSVTSWQLAIMAAVTVAGLAMSVVSIKPLNAFLLGENYARTMGVDVERAKRVIFASTILLAGTVTAFCGPVGFIGLAVPHIARMLFAEADHRVLMPGSILAGSAIMLFCDIVSQLPGSDMTLPINTVTALLGIPVVVVVIVRNNKIF